MRVLEIVTDAKTGETTERWVDMPDVMTVEEGQALEAIAAQQEATSRTLEERALTALDNLRAYRDLANPTSAQTVAAVKLLCRVAIGLIRIQLRRFDGTD